MELQKLVQHGLDGLRVFHTFFRRRVAPLAERRWPMWNYMGPTDPNRASQRSWRRTRSGVGSTGCYN